MGSSGDLVRQQWYWIRRPNGSITAYLFHRVRPDPKTGRQVAEFYVGSFLQTFELNQILGPAELPSDDERG